MHYHQLVAISAQRASYPTSAVELQWKRSQTNRSHHRSNSAISSGVSSIFLLFTDPQSTSNKSNKSGSSKIGYSPAATYKIIGSQGSNSANTKKSIKKHNSSTIGGSSNASLAINAEGSNLSNKNHSNAIGGSPEASAVINADDSNKNKSNNKKDPCKLL